MHKLLPNIDELEPIKDKNNTFYECGFNDDFSKLSFEKQLKIICDIVRQTMISNINVYPDIDITNLEGNCHTASLILVDYLKELKLGVNPRFVLVRRRLFEPTDITTKHALVLVDDNDGFTYQVDATPYVGYGYGEVSRLDQNRLYEEYTLVDQDKMNLINRLREIITSSSKDELDIDSISNYLVMIRMASYDNMLKGIAAQAYFSIAKYMDNSIDRNIVIQKGLQLNPYYKKCASESKLEYKKDMILRQVSIWEEELLDLLSKNDSKDYERILLLSQYITQEKKMLGLIPDLKLHINREYPFSHITPRLMYENGLNTSIIKASAYRLGVRSTIRESILDRGNGAIGEYFTNLACETENGIKPMIYSHPLGDLYERSMNGPADIFLVQKSAYELQTNKKELRKNLGRNIQNKEVLWYDNEYINWHPFVTNLVHSTDDPCEAALHYLIGYPEHQLMTRFMYPNPKIKKLERF